MHGLAAVILAGGRATRLGGIAKHAIVVDRARGETIFDRQRALLAPLCDELMISVRQTGASGSEHRTSGARIVEDVEANIGPLAGISAALAATTAPWLLVVAGDMPGLSTPLLALLAERARGDAHDAVAIRRGDGHLEPLLSALRVAPARAAVAAMLGERRHRVSSLYCERGLAVSWLDESEIRRVDPELRGLANINTPDDLPS